MVKLNPDTAWGTRTQTFSILGREQSATAFTTLVGSATYTFNPASGNTVTIPVSATAADVRLQLHREHRRAQRPGRRVPGDRHRRRRTRT